MSMGSFGSVTPVQSYMIMLAAIDSDIVQVRHDDDFYLDLMTRGRAALVRMLGQDFGYDLLAWHNYLMSDERLRYRYTFNDRDDFCFSERILRELESDRRNRLLPRLVD